MTEVEKRKEKLKIEEVGDKLTVAKWKLETCALEQDKLEQATRALEVEVAAAKNANQKAALLVSLEDKVASATRARQKLMLINHVDMGDTDEFGLLDAWPSVPAIATAANGLDEKLQAKTGENGRSAGQHAVHVSVQVGSRHGAGRCAAQGGARKIGGSPAYANRESRARAHESFDSVGCEIPR
jgi:hypothetical protein